MSGTLTICGTPLGNLEDVSLRVLRVLREVDCIAAEDTRRTLKLLNHYEIQTPLISFHEHNQKGKAPDILRQLSQGRNFALVSDAGMPCVSDPGQELVRLCHDNHIAVTAAPGPTAVTTALALSGFPAGRFVFEGFPPREHKRRKAVLEGIRHESRAVILYEAPHHLVELLRDLLDGGGNRRAAVIREMTKKHEEILHGDLESLLRHFEAEPPLGEFVIVLEALSAAKTSPQETPPVPERVSARVSAQERVAYYSRQGWDRKESMKQAARDLGVGKREIYRALLREEDE
ncbi:MAG: 16S rRNA (cytidine(1402)-2'-O)-methyltransferase [Clostridiales bacterium]|jgi:16S rRNA (cytidine1402-2'-O)-methyltransferase|nr:16S rRNA (cytidine(1402)-2'-O)-methyltransferase [Clostridiales bacterium]